MQTISEAEAKIENTNAARVQASSAGKTRFLGHGFGVSTHWGLYSNQRRGGEWALVQWRKVNPL